MASQHPVNFLGFVCPHCDFKEEASCLQIHKKQCKNSQRVISSIANKLFHKAKLSIANAFYIVFKIIATTKSVSAEQLAKTVGINRKSALLFQHKVRLAMQSSGQFTLKGQVEVVEEFIGQVEAGAIGRGAKNKAQIAVAVEKHGATGIKRVYIKMIENASTSQLNTLFEAHISHLATVLTDKWKRYNPIAALYNITQEKS